MAARERHHCMIRDENKNGELVASYSSPATSMARCARPLPRVTRRSGCVALRRHTQVASRAACRQVGIRENATLHTGRGARAGIEKFPSPHYCMQEGASTPLLARLSRGSGWKRSSHCNSRGCHSADRQGATPSRLGLPRWRLSKPHGAELLHTMRQALPLV